jgi:hypothetical protein
MTALPVAMAARGDLCQAVVVLRGGRRGGVARRAVHRDNAVAAPAGAKRWRPRLAVRGESFHRPPVYFVTLRTNKTARNGNEFTAPGQPRRGVPVAEAPEARPRRAAAPGLTMGGEVIRTPTCVFPIENLRKYTRRVVCSAHGSAAHGCPRRRAASEEFCADRLPVQAEGGDRVRLSHGPYRHSDMLSVFHY